MGQTIAKQVDKKAIRLQEANEDDLYTKVLLNSCALQCPICMEIFVTTPLLLACGHSFCEYCLANLLKKCSSTVFALACPICRTMTPVPYEVATGSCGLFSSSEKPLSKIFRKNYLFENILDDLKAVSQQAESFAVLDETLKVENRRLNVELSQKQQIMDNLRKTQIKNNGKAFVWKVLTMLLAALLIKQFYD